MSDAPMKRDGEIAVERLTAWLRDYGDEKPRVFIGDVSHAVLMAKQLLREHPADEDEPITCEWLSMLTTRQQDAHLTGRFIWVIAAGRFCAFIVTFEPPVRQFLFQANGQALIVVKTRGDVRRLTTALGIDLPTRIDNTPAAK